jgi:hypothetical protein
MFFEPYFKEANALVGGDRLEAESEEDQEMGRDGTL